MLSGIRPATGCILASSFDEGGDAWKVGVDDAGHPCILVQPISRGHKKAAAIALENFEAQFQVRCTLQHADGTTQTAHYTLLRLTSKRLADRAVFFSVCETIRDLVGREPDESSLYQAVARLVALFRRLLLPPTRTNIGLFGEMVFILEARSASTAIQAWRNDEYDRYDFSTPNLRIEVKTTSQPQRIHEFSYEQCDVGGDIKGVVASIIVERASSGTNVLQLQNLIEERLTGDYASLLKLRSVVAETIQGEENSGHGITFDLAKAKRSLAIYNLESIPAVRGVLQVGVSSVRFKSNLDLCTPLKVIDLIAEFSESETIFPGR